MELDPICPGAGARDEWQLPHVGVFALTHRAGQDPAADHYCFVTGHPDSDMHDDCQEIAAPYVISRT